MKILDQTALFVTGTDTGVGKTVASAAIARAWHSAGHEVCAVKAVAAGGTRNRDGHFFCEDSDLLVETCTAVGREILKDTLKQPARCPIIGLSRPMAPYTASKLDAANGRSMDMTFLNASIRKVAKACAKRNVKLIIEGAGGALVPLSAKTTVADSIAKSKLPALVVGRTELGTINHTLMTVEVLRARRIDIAGVVLSRQRSGTLTMIERASIEEIELFLGKKTPLMVLPFAKNGKPRLSV